MKAIRSFTVRARLPEALLPLQELALNLRWSWDERTRDLFRWVDPATWDVTGHDPVRLLGLVSSERLQALTEDSGFMSFLDEVHDDLRRHLDSPMWFQQKGESALRAVAYFSPEFGIAEALPQYSGGLGVLAGDHLKSASALGVPLIGVGLFYRQGYFRQELNADGWQQERYPRLDPHAMALTLVEGARVVVQLDTGDLVAQIWRADVGRVRLYLLDSDVDENGAEDRQVTDRLYGGDPHEHRIRQEILLGIGGVRALHLVGESPQVFHTNEGHAGFLGLERIRQLITNDGLQFAEALEVVRSSTVFTTHTPVPAGIDRFPRDVMERYFKQWCADCGVTFEDLMSLGHFPEDEADAPFNMAVMGFRLAARSNAVSQLHGQVSRKMFRSLWPDIPEEETPIGAVTNGVDALTWVAPEMKDLLARYVIPAWHQAEPDQWAGLEAARDDELWRAREQGRERLVAFVRTRLARSTAARGGASDAAWCDEVLDPRALTVGFARRFASYKRATLLLSQPDRLRALLLSADRPLQLVFAGKAHPADDVGKDMIRQVVQFARDPSVRHRIAFVEDYDIEVARTLYQGCDVWLNTPRRPLEACGTSGEKAALNGALNCSILDGWWDEMFDGENGWAISSAEGETDVERRDRIEADSLFEILEHQVVPLFYERTEGPVPRRWVHRVRSSLCSLGPQVVASRMLRDYVQALYEPSAAHAEALAHSSFARAKAVAAWKTRVRAGWDAVAVTRVESEVAVADLGTERAVEAIVSLGSLAGDDVVVQLLHGPVGANDELVVAAASEMRLVGLADEPGEYRYSGTCPCDAAGRYGFTVRVLPAHADLAASAELGLAASA